MQATSYMWIVCVCMCCSKIPKKSHAADLPFDLKVDDDDDIKQCSITYVVLNERLNLPTVDKNVNIMTGNWFISFV